MFNTSKQFPKGLTHHHNNMEITSEKTQIIERTENTEEKKSIFQIAIGLFSGFVLVLMIVGSATCVQLLNKRIPDLELNTFRCGLPLVMCTFWLLYKKRIPYVKKEYFFIMFIYSVVVFLTRLFLYVCHSYIPASSAQCTISTLTIISGIIIFALFWKEQIKLVVILCGLLCIVGVTLVVQPDFIFQMKIPTFAEGTNVTNLNATEDHMTTNGQILGYISASLAGILTSVKSLMIKKYNYLKEDITLVSFWSLFSGTIYSTVLMLIFENLQLPENGYDWFLMLFHCLSFAVFIPLSIYALRNISGNTFSMVFSLTAVFMLLSQYTVLSSVRPGHRNWIEVTGVILVLLGSGLSSAKELINSKVKNKNSV